MKSNTFNAAQSSKSKGAMNRLLVTVMLIAASVLAAGRALAQQIGFTRHVILEKFIAEGVGVGDVNRDGKIDIMAGAYWFEAPSWKKHELSAPQEFFYDKGYSDSFVSAGIDVNNDGWVDFARIDFPGKAALWHENPKNKSGHWRTDTIYAFVGNESAGFIDMDGDGRLDLLCANSDLGQMAWFKSPTDKSGKWQRFPISQEKAPGTERFSHGLGLGDVNKDGRKDIIIKSGWWEAPSDMKQAGWLFHEADLGQDCAQMYAFDVDGDGDNDIISSSAHKFGIWWHEQVKSGEGDTKWAHHEINMEYSQTHGLAFQDMNGDGNPDLITGKRYFAHMGRDTGEYQVPVLYWYEFKPGKQPQWIPHLVDDNSGVGVHVVVQDISKDGLPDIVVANKKGVFILSRRRRSGIKVACKRATVVNRGTLKLGAVSKYAAMHTNILWTGRAYHSLENFILQNTETGFDVNSVIIGTAENKIYKIEYLVRTNLNWETTFVEIKSQLNGSTESFSLQSDSKGSWKLNGKPAERFNGCFYIDISLTPFTNTLPINRLKPAENEQHEIAVIYFDILDQEIKPVQQKYTRLSENEYKFENVPNDFEAVIKVDELGLVVDYPGLFVRTARQ